MRHGKRPCSRRAKLRTVASREMAGAHETCAPWHSKIGSRVGIAEPGSAQAEGGIWQAAWLAQPSSAFCHCLIVSIFSYYKFGVHGQGAEDRPLRMLRCKV